MRSLSAKIGVTTLAIATALAFTSSNLAFAQRGGGGGHGGGGHGGGGGRGGGAQAGNQGGGQINAGGRQGGGRQGDGNRNWSGDRGGYGNRQQGGPSRQYGYWRPGPSNLNQFYNGRYGSGYRGDYYGRSGFGYGYGNYGYGYFPWYAGLAAYGLGRGYGYDGYVGRSAPVIVERYAEPAAPSPPPENDYVPQLNSTTAQLGAQPSGAALLGVTMDPEYPNAAVVRQVTPGSAAEKAGLRAGDMITTIDKRQIQSPTDVTNLVAAMQPGAMIEMEFIRPVLRSEVKEAAPEKGLGVTAPSTEAAESIPPPVPQPPAAD